MLNLKKCTVIFFALCFLFLSCSQQQKFEKNKWNEQTDPAFPSENRDYMIKDLTENNILIGLTTAQLINLVGIPDYKNDTSIVYKIVVKYNHEIDPVYIKSLDFKLSKDYKITGFKVIEWNK